MARKTKTTFESTSPHVVQIRGKALPVVVVLEGDTITFRHKGSRKSVQVSIADSFRDAVFRTSARL